MNTLFQDSLPSASSHTSEGDHDLERRIVLFIQQHQLSKGARLTISARLGVVTLVGIVPTFHQRQLLYSLTRRVAGVVQVRDELEVAHPPRTLPPPTERRAL